MCVEGAEDMMYNIGANDMMHLTGATFHAYENAWSVDMLSQQADAAVVLIFTVCEQPCARAYEPGQENRFFIVDCAGLLLAVNTRPWHNTYVASQVADAASATAFCDGVRKSPAEVQARTSSILSDATGGALVRVRSPLVMVVFHEPEFMHQYTLAVGANSSDLFSLAFRVTQVTAFGEKFSVRHFVHTVILRTPVERLLTFALRNGCTAIGLSAPAFGNVRSTEVGGRVRCVWECRGDMLRQPYNSLPPTLAQLEPTNPEYTKLSIKYACIALPQAFVASTFGFVVDTLLSPTDIGYAQALFDAVDRLSAAVQQDLTDAGQQGFVLLSIRDSVYHTSFDQRLAELQLEKCVSAGVLPAACTASAQTQENTNYPYQRRRLLSSAPRAFPAQIDGMIVISQAAVSQQEKKIDTILTRLNSVLVSAVLKHAQLLQDATGTQIIVDVEDIAFHKIVEFAVSSPVTPGSADTELARTLSRGRAGMKAVNAALWTNAGILCGVIAAALFVAWRCNKAG